MHEKTLKISEIKVDARVLSRAAVDEVTAAEYEENRRLGVEFPPVDVYNDGKSYWLADGLTRLTVEKRIGLATIVARVRQGQRSDAVWFSAAANLEHGLRPSRPDRNRAVANILLSPAFAATPQAAIARQCGVSTPTVTKVSNALIKAGKIKIAKGKVTVTQQTKTGKTVTYQKTPAGGPKPGGKKKLKTGKPAKVTKDQRGSVVPGYLKAVWLDREKLMEAATLIAAFPARVQKLTTLASGAGKCLNATQIKDWAGELRKHVKMSAPYVICDECRVNDRVCKTCKVCGGKAWLSENEYFEDKDGS